MKEKIFTITNRLGLHARPASLLVQTGARFSCNIKVTKLDQAEDIEVNGKSVMGLMMLAAAQGERLKIVLDGPDEDKALGEFDALFARRFDED